MTTDAPVALVTGGGGGLGRAVAAALQSAGHPVALVGRRREPLERARSALGRADVHVAEADVADRAAVEAAVRAVRAWRGPPGVVVNAAGIAASTPLLPPDDSLWARSFAVNATGAWNVSTACLPAMQEAGRGVIVNVGSTASLRGYRFTAAYVASKHALLGLTRALAEDLDGTGVRVNAVCPGFLDTPMTDRTVENVCATTGRGEDEVRAMLAKMNASGRLIPPEDVAEEVMELVRDDTRHGAVIRLE